MTKNMPMLEKLREFLKSKEGKKSIQDFARKLIRENQILKESYAAYQVMTDEQFLKLVESEIKKHDDRYIEGCYRRGYMPHFKKKLMNIFKVAEKYGKDFKPKEREMFAVFYKKYKGLTFILHQGQGAICEVNYHRINS